MLSRLLVASAALLALIPTSFAPSAGAQVGAPRAGADAAVQVTPPSAAPGSVVLVTLERWPEGAVNVSICGNDARRGSQDCDQISTAGMAVRDGAAQVRLLVPFPPVGCPCVVRATTPNNGFVQTTPLEIPGVPLTEPLKNSGGPASAKTIQVATRVRTPSVDLVGALQSLVAGPSPRELVVTVTNHGAEPVDGLRVVGAVGRRRTDGEPIESTEVGELVAGESRRIVMPFALSTPAWGSYEAFGSVYGTRSPIRFSARTTNDPWGIQVALPLILLVWARIERRRRRRRRVLVVATDPSATPAADVAATLPEGSPVVPNGVDGRWSGPAYLPAVNGHARAPHARGGRSRSARAEHRAQGREVRR